MRGVTFPSPVYAAVNFELFHILTCNFVPDARIIYLNDRLTRISRDFRFIYDVTGNAKNLAKLTPLRLGSVLVNSEAFYNMTYVVLFMRDYTIVLSDCCQYHFVPNV